VIVKFFFIETGARYLIDDGCFFTALHFAALQSLRRSELELLKSPSSLLAFFLLPLLLDEFLSNSPLS
jgi:hypothetical protein